MDDVTDLLLAARDGDEASLERLIRAAQGDVWRFCAGLVGPSGADDATQETFVRAWRSLGGFRGDGTGRSWLLTLARRTCADHLARRARRPVPTDAAPPGHVADSSEALALDDLLSRLDPDRRTAFVLTQVIGLRYAEAATVCGCPVGTIRSRVARARDDLIEASEGTPGAARRPVT